MRRTGASLSLSLLAPLSALAVATAAQTAHAQTAAEIAARRELLNQAQTAARARDHARAAELAERAVRIQASVSVRRFLADELNAAGRIAPALGAAEQCLADARRENNRRNLVHERACQGIVTQLTPRVGRLTVVVPTPTPNGLRLRIAGEEINSAFYGVPYVVTPGPVLVEAEATDHTSFRREIVVAAQGSETMRLELNRVAATPNPGTGGGNEPPRVGSVRIIVSAQGSPTLPAGTRITFDGEPVSGDPPTVASVQPGEHVVNVSAEGYVPLQTSVSIAAGQFRAMSLTLVRTTAAGSLRVISPVAGAQVALDGAIIGTVPLQRSEVPSGRHTLEVRASGYRPLQQAIEVQAGQEFTFNADSLIPDATGGPPQYRRARSPVGPVLIAVGIVGVAAGAGLWGYVPLVYWPTYSASPHGCNTTTRECTFPNGGYVNDPTTNMRVTGTTAAMRQRGFEIYESYANNFTRAGQIALGVGGGVFVLGLVLYFTVTYREEIPANERTAGLDLEPFDRGRARRASAANLRPQFAPTLDPSNGSAGLAVAF